jgi:hypothetical protein
VVGASETSFIHESNFSKKKVQIASQYWMRASILAYSNLRFF